MKDRSHIHEIEINAPAQEVWNALTNPDEMKKWFEDVAELEPKEGGKFRYAGEDLASTATITVWDPPRRFKVEGPPTPAPGGGGTPETAAQAFDYVIESGGHRSLLRMTHSGIPEDSSWDPYYEATNTGWGTVFKTLRHVVEEKPGGEVAKFTVFGGTDLPIEEVWKRVVGTSGAFEELGNARDDDVFSIETSLGDRWSGKVLHRRNPGTGGHKGGMITLSVKELGGALVSVATEPMMGQKKIVAATITTFDPAFGETADQYRKLFEESLEVQPLAS